MTIRSAGNFDLDAESLRSEDEHEDDYDRVRKSSGGDFRPGLE